MVKHNLDNHFKGVKPKFSINLIPTSPPPLQTWFNGFYISMFFAFHISYVCMRFPIFPIKLIFANSKQVYGDWWNESDQCLKFKQAEKVIDHTISPVKIHLSIILNYINFFDCWFCMNFPFHPFAYQWCVLNINSWESNFNLFLSKATEYENLDKQAATCIS